MGASRTRAPVARRPGSPTLVSGAKTRNPDTSTIANTSGRGNPAGTPVSWTLKPWIRPSRESSSHSNASEVQAGQNARGGQSIRPQPVHRVVTSRPSARFV
jgi:hypothetical protein